MRSKRLIADRMLEGIVVINKPKGMTSHDVVDRMRRKFSMQRVGHAGTLDPLATGVLVILLGKSTKLFGQFETFDKAYRATLILGQKTTTADIEGQVVARADYYDVTRETMVDVLKTFIGETEQTPPMVSAVKVNGSRLYQLARKGIEVKREARRIVISDLALLRFAPPEVEFQVACSKGTYVRQLAEDIGEKLGTVACISEIQRTKVGPFHIEDAVTLEAAAENDIRSWDPRVLPMLPVNGKIF